MTAFVAGSIPGYLLIQQITLKSEELDSNKLLVVDIFQRILMACIRNLGGLPCPRCEMQLSKVHLVGTKSDRRDRTKLLRVDDEPRRFKVSQARKHIYDNNNGISSVGVERMLKPLSLVPTTVRLVSASLACLTSAPERLLRPPVEVRFQLFSHVPDRSHARSRIGGLESIVYAASSYS